jgi:EAL domain-containing protein (putative c-di-GMP-specific phosphodiesterase class I)
VTDMVLATALRQRATWAAAGFEISVSVNVSTRDLHDRHLPETVAMLLSLTETPAQALTIEITESGIMRDPDRCLDVLDRLAAQGVQLSVDDFGTGYSSLAYLERLPVTEVKVDKSFVQRMEKAPDDATVIRATVVLAHDLSLTVVAEGVEDAAVWARLAHLGVDVIQGFLLGRPMPGADVTAWLQSRSRHLALRG